jgi:hypothetical protein
MEEWYTRPDGSKFNLLAYESIIQTYAERDSWLEDFLKDQISELRGSLSPESKGNPIPEDISQEDLITRCYLDAYCVLQMCLFAKENEDD